jgi:hypothetical protein
MREARGLVRRARRRGDRLLEKWIDEAERRTRFLFEGGRR